MWKKKYKTQVNKILCYFYSKYSQPTLIHESFKKFSKRVSKGLKTVFCSAVTFSSISSTSWNLFPSRTVFVLGKRKCSQENVDHIDTSEWSLVMTWGSVASARSWVYAGRTLRRPSSSVNLHGGFEESSPYCRSIHSPSFWEAIDGLMSQFLGYLRLCLHYQRLKDSRFLDHPEDPHARL
jgi:hypothetical protein